MRLAPFLILCAMASGQEWTPLFDGKSTSGWVEVTGEAFPSSWRVEEGYLRSIPNPHAFQDIRTTTEFEDFDLEFEWKIAPGGNGGVKYLIDKVDRWNSRTGPGYHARARGLEYQIIDNEVNADAKRGPERTTAALYGKLAPQGAECHKPGEWNVSRVVVRGGQAEHWLNGKLVLRTPVQPKRSPISLQHHNSDVWFRSIAVRTTFQTGTEYRNETGSAKPNP